MALRTKNAIRRSFIELLAERPFDKISVRDIAERSEVTRNTFYYYYTDIYALAEDVFESEIEKLSERVEGYESWQKAFLTATSFAAENKPHDPAPAQLRPQRYSGKIFIIKRS